MDPVNVGLLSVLPPIIAIGLALITKEVISSLLIGIFVGTFTYSFAAGKGFMGGITTMFNLMSQKLGDNATMILFLAFLGVLVVLVTSAGGAQAYGRWASTKIKSKAAAQLATALLGLIIFVDDYFNCLTVGTVMRPVTDRYKISRAKLAYLIDSTAAPICIIAPISSWAAAVGATLAGAKIFKSDILAFVSTIPYNLYALMTITMILILAVTNISYGPMKKLEREAAIAEIKKDVEEDENGKVSDLLIPIITLILLSILGMMYTGGFFGGDANMNFIKAFGNCDSSLSLAMGGFGAILVTFLLYVPRKVLSFKDFMSQIYEGFQLMIPAITILVLAWTISGVCRDLLNTGKYIGGVVQHGGFPMWLLPTIIFIVAAFLSFSMGTAWGTFGILVPIIIIICEPSLSTTPDLMTVSLAATLGGSVFGDHCSPISDTTILSSTGAECDHMDHVTTQIPYALTVAFACVIGYLVSGLTGYHMLTTLVTGFAVLFISLFVLNKLYGHKYTDESNDVVDEVK